MVVCAKQDNIIIMQMFMCIGLAVLKRYPLRMRSVNFFFMKQVVYVVDGPGYGIPRIISINL